MAVPGWDELGRPEQRLLIKLFGGGTTRRDDPDIVENLRCGGFIDENDQLSMPGLLVLTLAIREQQAAKSLISALNATYEAEYVSDAG